MSRPSNRSKLVEGALRCLGRLPPERVTARAITREAGGNLNSITHHFGGKEDLVTEAMLLGLERWQDSAASGIANMDAGRDAVSRIAAVVELGGRLCRQNPELARNFAAALVRAQHDRLVQQRLAHDFREAQRLLAERLCLGSDETAYEAAGLVQSLLAGTLAQAMVEPALVSRGPALERAARRILAALPSEPDLEKLAAS